MKLLLSVIIINQFLLCFFNNVFFLRKRYRLLDSIGLCMGTAMYTYIENYILQFIKIHIGFPYKVLSKISDYNISFNMKPFSEYYIINGLKIIIYTLSIFAFASWGIQAVQRYLSEPMATDITTLIGDDGTYIEFPQFTFCNEGFLKENSYLKDCFDEKLELSYISTLAKCMRFKEDFKIQNFVSSLELNQPDIITKISLRYQSDKSRKGRSLEKYLNQIWSPIFHDKFGLCFILNLSGADELKKIPVEGKPFLNLHFSDNVPWEWMAIIINSKHDLPDAYYMQPTIWLWVRYII